MKPEQIQSRQNQPQKIEQKTTTTPQGNGTAAPALRAGRASNAERSPSAARLFHLLSTGGTIAGTCVATIMAVAGAVFIARAIGLIDAPGGPGAFTISMIDTIMAAERTGQSAASQAWQVRSAAQAAAQIWRMADIFGMLIIGIPLLITGLDHMRLPAMFRQIAKLTSPSP